MRTKFLMLFLFSSTTFAQETLEDVVISVTRQELEQKLVPPPVKVIEAGAKTSETLPFLIAV